MRGARRLRRQHLLHVLAKYERRCDRGEELLGAADPSNADRAVIEELTKHRLVNIDPLDPVQLQFKRTAIGTRQTWQ